MKRISKAKRQKVWDKTGGLCAYCGQPLTGYWHIDHVIPQCLEGRNHLDNYLPACGPCNLWKNKKTPDEWREHILNAPVDQAYDAIMGPLERLMRHHIVDVDAATEAVIALNKFLAIMYTTSEYISFYFERANIPVPDWDQYYED